MTVSNAAHLAIVVSVFYATM